MRTWTCVSVAVVVALCATSLRAADAEAGEGPRVDVVFCIDCSGSMGGVIETAKQKVWSIVNEVARAKPTPRLRIGLIGYGAGDANYRAFPLTEDLDDIYKHLMTFQPDIGGDEWVGRAIDKATREMPWGEDKGDLRVIYVVGNETARQGPEQFDYAKTAPAAIARGIIVNAIYCESGDDPTWQEVARLADGKYLRIAADGGAVAIASPFDGQLGVLNAKLNETYLAYGPQGQAAAENQVAQDAAAATMPTVGGVVMAERAVAKASALYLNARWDLVDAAKQKDFDLKALADEQLPEAMRAMSVEERTKLIEAKAAERAKVQEEIAEVAAKRDAFVKAELERRGAAGTDALDVAVRSSIKEQAKSRGFEFAD